MVISQLLGWILSSSLLSSPWLLWTFSLSIPLVVVHAFCGVAVTPPSLRPPESPRTDGGQQRLSRKRHHRRRRRHHHHRSMTQPPETFHQQILRMIPSQLIGTAEQSRMDRKRKALPQLSTFHSQQDKNLPHYSSSSLDAAMIPSRAIHARITESMGESDTALQATAAEDGLSSDNEAGDTIALDATTTNSTTPVPPSVLPREVLSKRSRQRKRRPAKKNGPRRANVTTEVLTTGNFPDPWYRAVSMDHLRGHPAVLPLPRNVTELDCWEDVRQFRQDSWQWQILHEGRCTTSQAAGALGFLDSVPAQRLGIPPSWRRGSVGSYQRLRQARLACDSVAQLRQMLMDADDDDGSSNLEMTDDDRAANSRWWTLNESTESGTPSKFVAEYNYQPIPKEYERRRKYVKERSGSESFAGMGLRMIWGNTQEATSLLTALNYLRREEDSDVVLEEVGMCGAGLALNSTQIESSLLIGATPDGVLRYSNGTIEALEVKNHCPFFSNKGRKRHAGKVKAFSIGDRFVMDESIMAQYVPQMQMEMLCLGPGCTSALMVRQTATQGALLLRMRRDPAWIDEMLYFLHEFQRTYVEARHVPPDNCHWDAMARTDDSGAYRTRYRAFINRTVQLRNEVRLVARIPNEDIQRVAGEAPFFLDGIRT